MDSPIATLNIPVGMGTKNDRISKTPTAFQKNFGSFMFKVHLKAIQSDEALRCN